MTHRTAAADAVRTLDDWREIVADANVPALLMVVFQITGDARWLRAPFTPSRTAGLEENDDGGLPPEVRAEVRDVAALALHRTALGDPIAIPRPDAPMFVAMMSVCMGEDVSVEFATMLTAEWDAVTGADEADSAPAPLPPSPVGSHSEVLVIGAGVSGMTISRALALRGIDHVLVEKALEVGGAWRDNSYPGCGVDTPSHIYTHSHFRFDWSRHFAKRDEVFAYMRGYADEMGIRDRILLGHEVVEATWDERARRWDLALRSSSGEVIHRTARILVGATGQLNIPKIPDLPGMEDFRGELFHSAHWPSDIDLQGRRLAVVGSGASAMQIVPKVLGIPEQILLFQRSPQWIAPNEVYFTTLSESKRALLRDSPLYRFWYRARLEWTQNDRVQPSLRRDPRWPHPERSINAVNDGHRAYYERYIASELADRPELIPSVTPDYPPFGKRMLMDNGWYAALKDPSVELVTEAVAGFTPNSVVTADGREFGADVVVLATGFQTVKLLHPITIRGRDGVELHDYWGPDDAHAYLGIAVPGFPNLFLMCGPNTNLGHGGGWIQVAEFQADYIARAIEQLRDRGASAMEVHPGVEAAYTARVDAKHEQMIWTHPGMRNWYRNAAGRVVTNTPWRIVEYWQMTREVSDADYRWIA
jgi:4-hydroxyacetophenone monooxygenase